MITTADEKTDFDCGRYFEPLTVETLNDRGIEMLLAAVAGDAAKQWRKYVRQITQGRISQTAYIEKQRIEQWLLGDSFKWMGLGADGAVILRDLERECGIDKLSPEQKRKYDCEYMLKRMKNPIYEYQKIKYKQNKIRKIPVKKDGEYCGEVD